MKYFFVTLSIALAVVISSCSTIKSSTTKNTDIAGPTVIQKPVIADLDVKETKVTGTYSGTSRVSISQAKQMAVADALKSANADVLVEPRYEITKSFRKTEVTVTGYPATYKNFRPMEAADTIFLNTVQPEKDMPLFDKGSGRNNGRIALISSGGAVLAGGLVAIWLIFIY